MYRYRSAGTAMILVIIQWGSSANLFVDRLHIRLARTCALGLPKNGVQAGFDMHHPTSGVTATVVVCF